MATQSQCGRQLNSNRCAQNTKIFKNSDDSVFENEIFIPDF